MSKQVYFIGNSGMIVDNFEHQRFAVFYSIYIEESYDKKYYLFKVNGTQTIHRVPVVDYSSFQIDRLADKLWKAIIEIIKDSEKISVIDFNSILKQVVAKNSFDNDTCNLPKRVCTNTDVPSKNVDLLCDKKVHYKGCGVSIDFEDEDLFKQWMEGKLVGDLEVKRIK